MYFRSLFLWLQMADSHSTSGYPVLPDSYSMPAVPFASTSGQASASLHGFGGILSSTFELQNDSSSPTLSDSGISVDAASSASSARGTVAVETGALNHQALTNMLSFSSTGPPGMLALICAFVFSDVCALNLPYISLCNFCHCQLVFKATCFRSFFIVWLHAYVDIF